MYEGCSEVDDQIDEEDEVDDGVDHKHVPGVHEAGAEGHIYWDGKAVEDGKNHDNDIQPEFEGAVASDQILDME